MKRKFEEAVQSAATGINGSDSGGCQHDVFLLGILTDVFQESRFTRSCFPCQENRLASVGDQLQGILKLLITGVYCKFHVR